MLELGGLLYLFPFFAIICHTWITTSVEIVRLILFGPVYRNRLIKGLPVKMVARDAMDHYVNIELADGALDRDQYVNIMLSDGPHFSKFFSFLE